MRLISAKVPPRPGVLAWLPIMDNRIEVCSQDKTVLRFCCTSVNYLLLLLLPPPPPPPPPVGTFSISATVIDQLVLPGRSYRNASHSIRCGASHSVCTCTGRT